VERPVARFTVASTTRHRDQESGRWRDGDTVFLTCTAWGQLAENVAESLSKGTRVVVTGRLRQRGHETSTGDKRTVHELHTDEAAPSLRFATARVRRLERAAAQAAVATPSTE
jgi:single-strand DNA-binding protein